MARFESGLNLGLAILVIAFFASSLLIAPAASSALPAAAVGSSAPSASTKIARVTLTSPNAQSLGEFGTSVAATTGAVVVSAPLETVSGDTDAGRVYVFNSKTGALARTITSPNVQTGVEFGTSLAVANSEIVVGVPLESAGGLQDAGHVYTFSASTGALISTLTSPNPQTNGAFGASVAIYSNTVVVGALGESVSGFQGAGRAYTFNAGTGALVNSLTSPNAQQAGGFGVSVGVSQSVIVVGAWSETINGVIVAGRAYTFNPTTGALLRTLVSPNLQSVGEFGFSVAASGSTVIVGAWSETVGTNSIAGRVYAFNGATGALMGRFVSPNSQFDGQFGFSVALSGGTLVVGARGEAVGGSRAAGHVDFFNLLTGALEKTVTSPNAQSEGEFGFSVALSGGVFVGGALLETAGGHPSAGHAYIISKL
jgi:hypothetical protein